MSNPIVLFDQLREMYLRYLDSPFDLRYPDLVAERRDLLNVDGRLFRQPLIEPIPAYQSSNRTFQANCSSPSWKLLESRRNSQPSRFCVSGTLPAEPASV